MVYPKSNYHFRFGNHWNLKKIAEFSYIKPAGFLMFWELWLASEVSGASFKSPASSIKISFWWCFWMTFRKVSKIGQISDHAFEKCLTCIKIDCTLFVFLKYTVRGTISQKLNFLISRRELKPRTLFRVDIDITRPVHNWTISLARHKPSQTSKSSSN